MKNILIVIFLMATLLQAKEKSDRLYLYAKANQKEVQLKWFTKNYSSKYLYKIFRESKKEKSKLLKICKPISIKNLKKSGYDEDYIFMIYPLHNVKSINDTIQIAKIQNNVNGFRVLKWMRDDGFAKNLGEYFTDRSVEKNKIYKYTVIAYKKGRKIFARSIFAHTYKQQPNHDFMWAQIKNTPFGVALNWDVQEEYNYYNIYRKLDNEKRYHKLNKELLFITKEYALKKTNLYLDTSIKENESATYYIKRVNMFAKEGPPSQKLHILHKKYLKRPAIVHNIFVKNSDTKITLRWEKVPNILGYNIYRSTMYKGGFKKLNKKPITKEVFFDRKFQTGKNYYYYITALNLQGESLPSSTTLAYARDTTKPKRPRNLKATTKAGLVLLQWDKVKDKDLAGYRVYTAMKKNAKEWSLVNQKLIKADHFKHKKAKTLSRFPYYYYVTSVDTTYNESYPSEIIKVQLPDVTAPKEPFIRRYKSYSNKITIEWNKIFVYDLDHYNVYRKVKKRYIRLNKKPLYTLTFTDSRPLNGLNKYIVTSVDKSGNESLKRKVKQIYLKDTTPVKIKELKLTKSKTGIKISFVCKDSDYAGFKLFRKEINEPNYTNISSFIRSKSYTDRSFSRHTKYFYMIKAYDRSGNISESDVVEIKIK